MSRRGEDINATQSAHKKRIANETAEARERRLARMRDNNKKRYKKKQEPVEETHITTALYRRW